MMIQTSLFPAEPESAAQAMPNGFRYQPDLIDVDEEAALLNEIASLTLEPYEFHGYLAHRQVTAFGFRYNTGSNKMEIGPDLPNFLLGVRAKVALFAGRSAEDFKQVLVTEYAPGVALGWHRDRLHYRQIVGVSLLSSARFRLRRREGDRWLRVSQILEPRSIYMMEGDVRYAWEHSIPPVETLRFSLTFRTLADLRAVGC
jgi:alkylated DNA repair dioxygenase AlkB